MIPDPPPNTTANPYRGLSVQEVDVPLEEAELVAFLLGREVYRRTEYLVLRRKADIALVAVRKESDTPLFSPVTEVRVLAGPGEAAWIEAPEADVGNATALYRASAGSGRPGLRAYVVIGRHEHVNFLWQPQPVRIRVGEVVPPAPPKLFLMAEQAVAFDAALPPIELVPDVADLGELARAHPAEIYLLPCRGAGVDVDAPAEFLDTRPAERRDWLLIGCERSLQFHRHFYGDEPERVDICPRRRTWPPGLVLTKCCLLERGLEHRGEMAVVPWGAELDEVRTALRRLTGLE